MVSRLFLFTNFSTMHQQTKKTLFLLCLLFLVATGGVSAQTLVLHHADGSTTDVQLLAQPQVTFQGDRVLITSSVLNMDYDKHDVLRFTYKGKTSAIGSVQAEADVTQQDGQLVFHGVSTADRIALYTTSGIRVPAVIRHSGSDATLSLSAIPQGAYLLSVNGRTSKFTKR